MPKPKPEFCQWLGGFLKDEKEAGAEYEKAAKSAEHQFQPKWVINTFRKLAKDEKKHYQKLMRIYYKRC